ncbi:MULTISPECIES: Bug family tripartite tricarboxylate transporter substrate binding protein [Ramlibacter]|uniref:Tripartite tricarboxylate transporter substrate binding protein n=1 Tax=Ramlibacter pinisoli TaxID=2682844 RepID=A0A6N8IX33_9BURK|nr:MULTISPECIES: tripartite tricarboxylate transporter substrate binding protein [Ramlibacter]MBA2961453.1 tripartite tricarboxylate transporter substrate binding protein [Ramlibacter sp. CGMCC 1.13660]MVQ31397.1 tripartite tricarboxylate transporter substrate binding protein [Ramlibacter pinisoli]
MRTRTFLHLLVLALAVGAGGARAQAGYPAGPVRIIVPQTAGGPSDVLGRLFAQKLTESLGKPVIVENKPGAGGNIGTEYVVHSKPDGLNLLVNISGILAINQALYKQLPFDASRDLDGVARVVSSQLVLVAHPSFAPNNIKELVAAAKAQPSGSISYGSAGTGSPQHVGGELLNAKAGIKLNHVPYKGAVPALQDLVGGQIPLAIVGLPAVLQNMKAGKLKAIAVFGATRSSIAPEVPTFVESGFPEIEMELAYGIFAAKGTPRPVVDRLNQDLGAILKMPDVREKLLTAGFEVGHSSAADLDAYLRSEIQKWRPIVRDSGATAD